MKRLFIAAITMAFFAIAGHAQKIRACRHGIHTKKHSAIRNGKRATQPSVASLAKRSGNHFERS